MRKILKKISSRAGETIGETLVALLIASFALVMLAGAISTSTGIIMRSSKLIDNYYKANESLVQINSGATDDTLAFTTGAGDDEKTIPGAKVKYKKNDVLSKTVIAFKRSNN